MRRYSLLGHLVRQFIGLEENLATEGLNYILWRSPVARRALIQFIAQASGLDISENLDFQTQDLQQDRAMPDLVGFNRQGQQPLVIEAKFWAPLTPCQPVTYINRLPADTPGVVVFLAPATRLDELWAELLQRCQKEGWTEANQPGPATDPRSLRLGAHRALTLVSWRRLLGMLVEELEAAGETDLVSDAQQLLGLCEQMDGSSFLPLRSEERAPLVPEAIRQQKPLIDLIVQHVVAQGVASGEGQYWMGEHDWFGCHLNVDPYLFLVSVDERHRVNYANTPFWLSLYRHSGRPLTKRDKVKVPQPCLFVKDQFGKDHCVVPLFAPEGAGQDVVADEVAVQVGKVASYLRQR